MKQKQWAAAQHKSWRDTSYLREEVGSRILESIKDLKEVPSTISIIGTPPSSLLKGLSLLKTSFTCYDTIGMMEGPIINVINDESVVPPLKDCKMLISSLNMHWINDLKQYCTTIHQKLPLNSAFSGCLFGGDSLYELRSSLILAQEKLSSSSSSYSSISSHLSPTISAPDLSTLLFSSKFKNVTVSSEYIKVIYPTPIDLLEDLQKMGESAAPLGRARNLSKTLLKGVVEEYSSNYKQSNSGKEGVQATFEVLSFIAWKE